MRNEAFCSVELYRRTLSDNPLVNYFTVVITVAKIVLLLKPLATGSSKKIERFTNKRKKNLHYSISPFSYPTGQTGKADIRSASPSPCRGGRLRKASCLRTECRPGLGNIKKFMNI
jgi:hypothetical protein